MDARLLNAGQEHFKSNLVSKYLVDLFWECFIDFENYAQKAMHSGKSGGQP